MRCKTCSQKLRNSNQMQSVAPWLAVPIIVIAIAWALPQEYLSNYVNWAFLVGTVVLAFPTIRVNEQGRQIARIRPLVVYIKIKKERLASLEKQSNEYKVGIEDLSERQARLTKIEQELSSTKGQWTCFVHSCFYGGYGLILGTTINRVVFL